MNKIDDILNWFIRYGSLSCAIILISFWILSQYLLGSPYRYLVGYIIVFVYFPFTVIGISLALNGLVDYIKKRKKVYLFINLPMLIITMLVVSAFLIAFLVCFI